MLDLPEKLVNLSLEVRTDLFPLLILLSGEDLHVLRVVSFESSDTVCEGVFHTSLLLGVYCLQTGHIFSMLLLESCDLSVQLADLITRICRQTLDLFFEALNFPLQGLDLLLKSLLHCIGLSSSVLQNCLQLLYLLLQLLALTIFV